MGGDEEQIKTFPRDQFADYWNTWYRPENMTFLVVGDIDPQELIAKGKEKLGTFTARGPARPAMKAELKPFSESRALIVTDPEQVTADVSFMTLKPGRPPIATYSQFRLQAVEGIGEWIVNRRIDELVAKGGTPFRDASVDTGDLLNEVTTVSAEASGEPQDWNKMLDATIAEVNRAIDHGFTQRELDLAKKETLRRRRARRADGKLARERADHRTARRRRRPGSADHVSATAAGADEESARFGHARRDSQGVRQQLQERHARVHPDDARKEGRLHAAERAGCPRRRQGRVGEEDERARGTEGRRQAARQPARPGKVVKQDEDTDLKVTTVEFANGVVMHHKFNDYKKDSVSVRITMPAGKIEETIENKGISELAGLSLARRRRASSPRRSCAI